MEPHVRSCTCEEKRRSLLSRHDAIRPGFCHRRGYAQRPCAYGANKVEDCAAFISRTLPEAERPAFVQELHALTAQADEAPDAETRAQRARAVVVDLVHKAPGMIEGTDRGA